MIFRKMVIGTEDLPAAPALVWEFLKSLSTIVATLHHA
jgi:hypothetical protein